MNQKVRPCPSDLISVPSQCGSFSLGLLLSSIFLLILEYAQLVPTTGNLHMLFLLPVAALPINNLHTAQSFLSSKSHINHSLTEITHPSLPNTPLIDVLHSSCHSCVLFVDPCLLLYSLRNRNLQESIDGLSTLQGAAVSQIFVDWQKFLWKWLSLLAAPPIQESCSFLFLV